MVDQIGLNGNERLNDHVSHLCLQVFDVDAIFGEPHEDGIETTLVSGRGIRILIGLVVRVVLVDGIVGEMDKRVVEGF